VTHPRELRALLHDAMDRSDEVRETEDEAKALVRSVEK